MKLELTEKASPPIEGEKAFTLHTYDPEAYEEGDESPEYVTVHSWERGSDSAVFLEIGDSVKDGVEDDFLFRNIIVDKESFITGILFAFPELERRER